MSTLYLHTGIFSCIAAFLIAGSAAAQDPEINITVTFADSNGDAISEIAKDTTFRINVLAKDIRPPVVGENSGVFSAFADVLYDASLIDVTGIVHVFGNGTNGTIDNGIGEVDEAGGSSGIDPPDNAEPQLVFFLEATANEVGTLVIQTDVGENTGSQNTVLGIDTDRRDFTMYNDASVSIMEPSAQLDVAPNPLVFGDVASGESRTRHIGVSNPGADSISIGPISLDDSGFTANWPQTDVPGGETILLPVDFAPAAIGSALSSLTIDATTVSLAGTGTDNPNLLTMTNHTVAAEHSGTITVTVDFNSDRDFAVLPFLVEFDNGLLEALEYRAAGRTILGPETDGINNEAGNVNLVFGQVQATTAIPAGTGSIAEIDFQLKNPPAAFGVYPLEIVVNSLNVLDIGLNTVPIAVQHGELDVLDCLLGDVDGSGVRTALDAIFTFRTVTGLSPIPSTIMNPDLPSASEIAANVEDCGDFNKDGIRNALDAIDVFRFATGLPPREGVTVSSAPKDVQSRKFGDINVATGKTIAAPIVEGLVGSTVTVAIELENDVDLISAAFRVLYDETVMNAVAVRTAGRAVTEMAQLQFDLGISPGVVGLGFFTGSTPIAAGVGPVIEIDFEVLVETGTSSLDITFLNNFFDDSGTDISADFSPQSGTFTAGCTDLAGPVFVECADPVVVDAGVDGMAQVPDLISGVTVTDDCDTSPTLTQVPAVDDPIGVGDTVVVLTAEDGFGNTTTCTAVITVEAPFTFEFVDPNTGETVTTLNPAPGQTVTLQIRTVNSTRRLTGGSLGLYALDFSSSDTELLPLSSFSSAIADFGFPDAIVSDGTIALLLQSAVTDGLDSLILGTITFDTPSDDGTYLLTTDGGGSFLAAGFPINDPKSPEAHRAATIVVGDAVPPTIIACAADRTLSADTNCEAIMPDLAMMTSATDNVDTPGQLTKVQSVAPTTVLPFGETIVVITVTDASGNTATCVVSVDVADFLPPVITNCPAEVPVAANANCEGLVPDLTGSATVDDNCDDSVTVTQSPAADALITDGSVVVVLEASDDAGNTSTCTVTVTVVDDASPSIVCPVDQDVAADANCEGLVRDLTGSVTVADNCDDSVTVTQNPAADVLITDGSVVVVLEASDNAGNTATCSVTVNVVDDTAPEIFCPPDQTVAADGGCAATVPDLGVLVTATDNCDTAVPLTVSQSPAVGAALGAGDTTVTLNITDETGGESNCDVVVTAANAVPPVISACAAARTIAVDGDCQFPVPDLTPEVVATDTCESSVLVSQSPLPDTDAPIGTLVVVLTASDSAGNQSTCTATVTGRDITPPTITALPARKFVAFGAAALDNNILLEGVFATDNCDGDIPGLIQVIGSVDTGVLGDVVIQYQITDNAGNVNTASRTYSVIAPNILALGIVADQTAGTTVQVPLTYDLQDFIDVNELEFYVSSRPTRGAPGLKNIRFIPDGSLAAPSVNNNTTLPRTVQVVWRPGDGLLLQGSVATGGADGGKENPQAEQEFAIGTVEFDIPSGAVPGSMWEVRLTNVRSRFNGSRTPNRVTQNGQVSTAEADVNALIIKAGFDLLATADTSSTFFNFAETSIPPDFFGTGSDPFFGTINVMGAIIDGELKGTADTIIERLQAAELPSTGPFEDTIDIELVALSLQSSAPITVSFFQGGISELWDVDVRLSPTVGSSGQMTIRRSNGTATDGTFDVMVDVIPELVFIRQSDGAELFLDAATFELGPFLLSADNVPWDVLPAADTLEVRGVTSNFFPDPFLLADGPNAQQDLIPATQVPEVYEWQVIAEHAGLGDVRTRVFFGDVVGNIEGIRRLCVNFATPLDPMTVVNNQAVTFSDALGAPVPPHTATTEDSDHKLVIEFAAPLVNANHYLFELSDTLLDDQGGMLNGVDRTLFLSALRGDINNDGGVNVGDILELINRIDEPVTVDNAHLDANLDGNINVGDLLLIRANRTITLPDFSPLDR